MCRSMYTGLESVVRPFANKLEELASAHKSKALSDYEVLRSTLLRNRVHALFGSFVNGTYTHFSDLDISICSTKAKLRCLKMRAVAERDFRGIVSIDARTATSATILSLYFSTGVLLSRWNCSTKQHKISSCIF